MLNLQTKPLRITQCITEVTGMKAQRNSTKEISNTCNENLTAIYLIYLKILHTSVR